VERGQWQSITTRRDSPSIGQSVIIVLKKGEQANLYGLLLAIRKRQCVIVADMFLNMQNSSMSTMWMVIQQTVGLVT
jgi:hypothetical protein